MSLPVYIHHVTGRVFKMLALREQQMGGDDVYWDDYVDSLIVDLCGALGTFPVLAADDDYIVVTNIVHYVKSNVSSMSFKAFKREVFKALRLLNRIESRIGGDAS